MLNAMYGFMVHILYLSIISKNIKMALTQTRHVVSTSIYV
jgi:hypothetical protein